jgi:hypothetical protein
MLREVRHLFHSHGNVSAEALAALHAMQGRLHRRRSAPNPPAVFIVGSPRSGTTLLRLMLDSHPQLAIPPETGFIPRTLSCIRGTDTNRQRAFCEKLINFPRVASSWCDFGISQRELLNELQTLVPFQLDEAIRCFYRLYAARFGKTRWGDKTPNYGSYAPVIQRILPEASFVHVIRDGRDVALSLRNLWFSPGRDMSSLARQWRRDVSLTRKRSAKCRRYIEIRYESLVRGPELELRRICSFLELDFDPAMMRYYERAPGRLSEHGARVRSDGRILATAEERLAQQKLTMIPPDASRISSWKTEMQANEQVEYEAVAGPLLRALGY